MPVINQRLNTHGEPHGNPAHRKVPDVCAPEILIGAVALALGALASLYAAGASAVEPAALRDVVVVGNNWDGTADVFDPQTFQPRRDLSGRQDLSGLRINGAQGPGD